MDAIEFVKKFDIEMTKHAVSNMPLNWNECYLRECDLEFVKRPPSFGNWVCMDDLKKIVEAFELVEVGLPELKESMFSNSRDLEYVKNWVLTVSEKLLTEKGIKLKQAIELVESCQ